MQKYLVIGIYYDGSRFADDYEANSPEDAEALAEADHPGLEVAGVVNEKGEVVA